MTILSHSAISALHITPMQAMGWIRESFSLKKEALLPHKISLTFEPGKFMNTMPCMVPALNVFGYKVITRYPDRNPSVDGDIMLYDYATGCLRAILDAFWITTARTGAVAAIVVQALARKDFDTVALMGLGNTGYATAGCLAALYGNRPLMIKVLAYKDHAEQFIRKFSPCTDWQFSICRSGEDLVENSDVIISCITNAEHIIADDRHYRPGCLVVPVHTKGFQNCDLFFDRVIADDEAHVNGFKYFNRFRYFGELAPVLEGIQPGRENDDQRILSYNIGLGLHDIVFAHHICRQMEETSTKNKIFRFS